jgi:hypothetical protein
MLVVKLGCVGLITFRAGPTSGVTLGNTMNSEDYRHLAAEEAALARGFGRRVFILSAFSKSLYEETKKFRVVLLDKPTLASRRRRHGGRPTGSPSCAPARTSRCSPVCGPGRTAARCQQLAARYRQASDRLALRRLDFSELRRAIGLRSIVQSPKSVYPSDSANNRSPSQTIRPHPA